jgi:rfaE bifunctional protein nucleotidyltransferase chain/domain
MSKNKIKELRELADILEDLRRKGKKIVHCHGCFDMLHIGHMKHFEEAKEQGDFLVVTLTRDKFIQKGPGRPFFNQELRLQAIAALEVVDFVALNDWPTAVETIQLLKPNVYVKGKEVLGNASVDVLKTGEIAESNLSAEERAIKSIGGQLHLTEAITFSSSNIINEMTDLIPEETKTVLKDLKKDFPAERIFEVLDSLKDIRILIIGDSILDEYVFCKQMEKSGKEAFVAYKFLNSEIQAGGIFAIANHVAGFTKNVTLITAMGRKNSEIIPNKLDASINSHVLIQTDSETIVKRRYLDEYKGSKLFETYTTENLTPNQEIENKILNYLDEDIYKHDMILIGDFGHGLITSKIREKLISSNKFLAINSQLNSGNLGYNFVTKYSRANFVALNDREIRLPLQEKESDIRVPIKKLSELMNLNKINITLGKSGSIYYQDGEYHQVPAFTKNVIDTIGSGDAVLSLTSLLTYKGVDPRLVPFLGNCMGALSAKIIGNRRPVNPTELRKTISYILK